MEFVGLQKVSLMDYDGYVGCTIFSQGCNFRCPFCHNKVLVFGIDTEIIPFDEILEYLRGRKSLLDAVTITGGEPTLMNDLKDKIIKIKELGYRIKLDTNGTNPDILKDLVENQLIDYVAMDIKNCSEKYAETCGLDHIDFEKIQTSINYLIEGHVDYEFRTTVISEFHQEIDMEKIGKLINGAKRYFIQKFVSSEHCINENLNPIPQEKAERFKNILLPYIRHVELRGY